MRTIEELRPIVKGLYPNGLWIGHVQPLTKICCGSWASKETRMKKHGHLPGYDPNQWCPSAPDTELWPIPKDAAAAGIEPEEWAAYAKKAWYEWFSGGPDGTVLTAIGTITPEAHQEIGQKIYERAVEVTKSAAVFPKL